MATYIPCYFDAFGYLVCPAQAAQTAVPAHVVSDPNIGWNNAAAESISALDNDMALTFNLPVGIVGAYVALTSDTYDNYPLYPLPIELLDFAMVASDASAQYGSGHAALFIYEFGVVRGGPYIYAEGTDLVMTRQRGVVTYTVGGSVVYTSLRKSIGYLYVTAGLYCAGDTIP